MRKEAERHEESMREQRRRFEAELRGAEERAMQSNMKLAGLAAGGKENRKVRSPRNPPPSLLHFLGTYYKLPSLLPLLTSNYSWIFRPPRRS